MTTHYRSKALATWVALIGGGFGLHRFYLHGFRDVLGWLWAIPTLAGAYGIQRVFDYGQDDQLSWLLIPMLGISLAGAMFAAILYALMSDEKWNARFNPDGPESRSGWSTVLGAATALLLGASVLMATIAFGGQRYFEYQVEEARKISQ